MWLQKILSKKQILSALVKSLHTTEDKIEFLCRNEDVFVINRFIDEEKNDNGFIDSYWIDITEYVIEVQKQRDIRTYYLNSRHGYK
ncbi:hypothetical protein AAV01_13490 [Listeria monocytogenes]|nr:hypothetical protein [Listeria monocytogenes]